MMTKKLNLVGKRKTMLRIVKVGLTLLEKKVGNAMGMFDESYRQGLYFLNCIPKITKQMINPAAVSANLKFKLRYNDLYSNRDNNCG